MLRESSGGFRGRWGMVCAGTALIGTCYGFARFAYGLFAPEFNETFAISSTISGIIGSGSYIGYCVAIVLSLILTERVGARRVGVGAGVVATIGTATVALAPSSLVLAAGVLVAGSSTGIASPPMAAAVSRWVREGVRDRAQSVVNAGTGIGVLVSGPIALVLIDQWRWAWGVFSLLAAAVTLWIWLTVPHTTSEGRGPAGERGFVPGTALLLLGAFLMGLSSVAMWTFGRDLITSEGGAGPVVSTSMWTVLGAAGFVGALSGDLIARSGLARSWTMVMIAIGGATALLGLAPASAPVAFLAGGVFGAAYVGLCGLVLLWSTSLYPERASFGVGVSFMMIAVGQTVGAPLAGALTDAAGGVTAFYACAAVGLLGSLVRPGTKPDGASDTPAPIVAAHRRD
ncbi:MFS transporter [Actinomadura sp. KC06]|uniref:MFS transporter n=1 Tax=Actinomadura sp. KC06 TaxID=2530369 RepID=UPI001044B43D|nr:MFS transporter [Actinomadura sp. KC06]TDD37276.1 MFS transporter [Actinomadura sp. KC06]